MDPTKEDAAQVEVKIPRPLNMSILRIQVDENLDWGEACLKASDLLDTNSERFKKQVHKEAQRIHRSQFMTQLNKSRETIRKEEKDIAFSQGQTDSESKHSVWFNCSKCGKPIFITPNSDAHKAVMQFMKERGWKHINCPKT